MSSDRNVARQLWSLTWPLILASSSTCLMSLTGRCILAHYAPSAFNTHIGAAVWYEVLQAVLLNLVSIVGVFVGHYNGRKQFFQIGPAVWQMLWLSFGAGFLLLPLLWRCVPHLLAENLETEGVPYLRILFGAIPFHCATFGAIGAFFTGRKVTHVLPLLVIFHHSVNILLTVLLVFGRGGFPECGLRGCGIATIIAQLASLSLILPFFLARRNRETFHTGCAAFSPTACWRYARFGLPSSLNSLINGVSWCWIVQVVAGRVSFGEFSALGLILSLERLLSFLSESLGRGNCILAANFLGERQGPTTVRAVLLSSLKLWLLLSGVLLPLIRVFQKEFVAFFLGSGCPEVGVLFRQMLPWAFLLMFLEGIWFQLHYALTAFRDTPFLTGVNVGSHCLFLIMPAWFLLHGEHPRAVVVLQLAALHQLIRSGLLGWRYRVLLTKIRPADEF